LNKASNSETAITYSFWGIHFSCRSYAQNKR